jgi:hypothetical protein
LVWFQKEQNVRWIGADDTEVTEVAEVTERALQMVQESLAGP